MAMYRDLVEGCLNIRGGDFWGAQRIAILGKLYDTGTEMQEQEQEGPIARLFVHRHDIFGINQCLHLASTVLLLGSRHGDLTAALDKAREVGGPDPTTVVTVAVLHYLVAEADADIEFRRGYFDKVGARTLAELRSKGASLAEAEAEELEKLAKEEAALPRDHAAVEYIHQRFDTLSWMIGWPAAHKLGIEERASTS